MKLIMNVLLLIFLSSPVVAEQIPSSLQSDKRIKTVLYTPDNVVKLYSHYLFTTTIVFAPYEKIIGVFPGDASAWKILSVHNRIILKPIALGKNIQTNLYVVTSANREYHFTLIANYTKDPNDARMLYKLKFIYPQDDAAKKVASMKEKQRHRNSLVGTNGDAHTKDPSLWNLNYSYKGDKSILPIRVFDNGTFTYFEFPKGQEFPAIFYVYPDTREALVNYRVKGKYVVVERVGGQFTLRSGKTQTACIFNEPFLAAHKKKKKAEKKVMFSKLRERKKIPEKARRSTIRPVKVKRASKSSEN